MTRTKCPERPAYSAHDAVVAVLLDRRARRLRTPASVRLDSKRPEFRSERRPGVSLLERLAYASLPPHVRVIRLACSYRRARGPKPLTKREVTTFVGDRVLAEEAVELALGVYAEVRRQETVVKERRPTALNTRWSLMPVDARRRAVVESVFGVHFERPNAVALRIPRPGIVTALVSYWDLEFSRFRTLFMCRSGGLTVSRHVDDLSREQVLDRLEHGLTQDDAETPSRMTTLLNEPIE
jgi:hypothetical protein